ncbi:Glucose--fructose oxidoreductase [Planctomycetales bacterium 10988]|nr:Glucose--fructose oxidoreductase [Planctomycetales bacterium 10988]
MAKTFRVGIIGHTGRGDYGHSLDLGFLKAPNCEIVAVADADRSGLAAAAKRLSAPKTFVDYRQMIEEVKPEIVAICPRWIDQHFEMARTALELGCHVYMEKPMCQTLAQTDTLVNLCEQKHLKLALAYPTRYSPKLTTVQEMIHTGKIGQLLEFRARGKEDHRGGAEDLWVLGSHLMDLFLALGGAPKWCFAQMTKEGQPVEAADIYPGNEGLGPLAGDAVSASFGMPGGVTASFHSVKQMQGNPSRYGLQILGSRGIIEILEGSMAEVHYLDDPGWSPGRSGKEWKRVSTAGVGKPEPLTDERYKDRHRLAIADLLAAIENERQPLANVYEGRLSLEMIHGVFESTRLGKPVTFPLENREHPLAVWQQNS